MINSDRKFFNKKKELKKEGSLHRTFSNILSIYTHRDKNTDIQDFVVTKKWELQEEVISEAKQWSHNDHC